MKIRYGIILMIVFLIAGCVSKKEYRYKCSSFSTPWSYSASIDDGMIWWRSDIDGYSTSYKIPFGDICKKEIRNIEP
jgi:hypothetical protein